jgi:3-methyladenine DNA glycosylase AlkD
MNSGQIINQLKQQKDVRNIEGMARFGISSKNTLGISVRVLREVAKKLKSETASKENLHKTSLELWKSRIHEARILATIIDPPDMVTEEQADSWVKDIDSWDICDGFCLNLIDKTDFALKKIPIWASEENEYIRRAAFSLIAGLAVHQKHLKDSEFEKLFPLIKKYSRDERNFVRKSVSWSLRQVGKRNMHLLSEAIITAKEIGKINSNSSQWVARDVLRELEEKL